MTYLRQRNNYNDDFKCEFSDFIWFIFLPVSYIYIDCFRLRTHNTLVATIWMLLRTYGNEGKNHSVWCQRFELQFQNLQMKIILALLAVLSVAQGAVLPRAASSGKWYNGTFLNFSAHIQYWHLHQRIVVAIVTKGLQTCLKISYFQKYRLCLINHFIGRIVTFNPIFDTIGPLSLPHL